MVDPIAPESISDSSKMDSCLSDHSDDDDDEEDDDDDLSDTDPEDDWFWPSY